MNSVHEPGPNGDTEITLSRKLSQVHKTLKLAQPAHQARPSARARGRVMASLAPCHGQPSAVSWPRPWPRRRRKAPYRGRCQRRVVGASAVSQRTMLPCPRLSRDTALPHALLPITIHLSVLQHTFQPSLAASVTIQILYSDTALIPGQATLSYHDTLSVL